MARIQVLQLPGRDGEPPPFALVIDQVNLADIDKLQGRVGQAIEDARERIGARAVLVFNLDMDVA